MNRAEYLRSPLPVWRLRWQVLTTPSCWFRSHPTHQGLSRYVNHCLNTGAVPEMHEDGLSFRIGSKDLFALDFPTAFGGQAYREEGYISVGYVMVDRKTAFRLYDLIGAGHDFGR